MIEAVLLVLGGVLGSGHCVGMCGGLVLSLGTTRLGRPPSRWSSLLGEGFGRQLVYALGRVQTYGLLGAMAGYGGWRLLAQPQTLVNVQAVLALLAGFLLVGQGLAAVGWRPWRQTRSGGESCAGAAFFASWLDLTRSRQVFLAGMINGLLPCGLVYGYLALAASSAAMGKGAVIMLLFGLGTIPTLVLVGCGGAVLGLTLRRRLFWLAGWCVVLTGLLTLVRGFCFLKLSGQAIPDCPFCS